MEIPKNDYNPENDVERAVAKVLSFMKTKRWEDGGHADVLKLNHGIRDLDPKTEMGVTMPIALKVADRFKEKGYYAHFNAATTGRVFELVITRRPTNKDI